MLDLAPGMQTLGISHGGLVRALLRRMCGRARFGRPGFVLVVLIQGVGVAAVPFIG